MLNLHENLQKLCLICMRICTTVWDLHETLRGCVVFLVHPHGSSCPEPCTQDCTVSYVAGESVIVLSRMVRTDSPVNIQSCMMRTDSPVNIQSCMIRTDSPVNVLSCMVCTDIPVNV